jgi:hypothetical protein
VFSGVVPHEGATPSLILDLGIKPETKAQNPKYPNPYPFSPKPGTQIVLAGIETENPNLVWA